MKILGCYIWMGYQNFSLGPFWLFPSPIISYFKFGLQSRPTGRIDSSGNMIHEYISYQKNFMIGAAWGRWGYVLGIEWIGK